MPNRILKESIRTSKTVNAMTDFQFRVWVYLITYVDDYGRGSADPELIKGFCFPRRKRVSESDIGKTLAELAGMGCISLYDVDGESYFYFPNWGKHQRIQTKKSKYPAPEESNSPSLTVTHRESPPESESKSESKSENSRSSSAHEPLYDEDAGRVVREYQQYFGMNHPPQIDTDLINFCHSLGADVCIAAIHHAIAVDARNWRYLQTVLNNCERDNIRTLEDWERNEAKRNSAKKRGQAQNAKPESSKWDNLPGVTYL